MGIWSLPKPLVVTIVDTVLCDELTTEELILVGGNDRGILILDKSNYINCPVSFYLGHL